MTKHTAHTPTQPANATDRAPHDNSDPIGPLSTGIAHRLRSALSRVAWVRFGGAYRSMGSAEFGRNIARELKGLQDADSRGALFLKLRNKRAAVVLTMDHYNALRETVLAAEQLLEHQAADEVRDSAAHFDELYARITAPGSKAGADALFNASADDLRGTYQPGATEQDR